MNFIELNNDDKARLINLNNDRETVFALKKLFLNVVCGDSFTNEVPELAAERIAMEWVKKIFVDLHAIQPEERQNEDKMNQVI